MLVPAFGNALCADNVPIGLLGSSLSSKSWEIIRSAPDKVFRRPTKRKLTTKVSTASAAWLDSIPTSLAASIRTA